MRKKSLKKMIALLLCTAAVISCSGCGSQKPYINSANPGSSYKQALKTAEKWLKERIENNQLYSFSYNGADYDTFIDSWDKTVEESADEQKNRYYTVTYTSPESVVFRAEVMLDITYASLDWCCYFENRGNENSPVISDILPLDYTVELPEVLLTSANGSQTKADDFEPFSVSLEEEFTMQSIGGRSSCGGFPYFELSTGESGVLGAIGWSGDWKASFVQEDKLVHVSAGMKKTNISLYPGEDMRTPSSVLMFYEGDQDAGHNKFRRLVLNSYTPTDKTGAPVTILPNALNMWGAMGEENLLREIERCENTGFSYDTLWVDAGWYCNIISLYDDGQSWSAQVGNWTFNEGLYPNGFQHIAERTTSAGKELLLWFEPERASVTSVLATEYPQYLLPKASGYSHFLYNFTDDEATDYMIDLVSDILTENKVSWYRHDFNMDPMPTWTKNDKLLEENRTGITEIKYITNLYRYFDTLCETIPGLKIDNCASGGRRLDIEMAKRSVPLWRTDYNLKSTSTADTTRLCNYGLSWWLPTSGGGFSVEGASTSYQWRSLLSSGMTIGYGNINESLYQKGIDEYQACREFLTGDYYILKQGTADALYTEWAAYEYYRPLEGDGCLTVFRPRDCEDASTAILLKGLEPDASYELHIADTGETLQATGKEWMENGLTLTLDNPNTSYMIFITRQ